jgi:hypothetical protein
VPKPVQKLFQLLKEDRPKELSLRGNSTDYGHNTHEFLKDLEEWILEETSKKG